MAVDKRLAVRPAETLPRRLLSLTTFDRRQAAGYCPLLTALCPRCCDKLDVSKEASFSTPVKANS
jgi:hypothetical protein